MRKKYHKPEEIVSKLRQVDVLTSQGRPVADAIRPIGVTEVTYYRWRKEEPPLKIDDEAFFKELDALGEDQVCGNIAEKLYGGQPRARHLETSFGQDGKMAVGWIGNKPLIDDPL